MAVKPVVYDDTTKKHRPLGSGEKMDGLSASSIVSSQSGNIITTGSDGLAYATGSGIADPSADNLLETTPSGKIKLDMDRLAEWLDGHPADAKILSEAVNVVSGDSGNVITKGSDKGAYMSSAALASIIGSMPSSQTQSLLASFADGQTIVVSGGKLVVDPTSAPKAKLQAITTALRKAGGGLSVDSSTGKLSVDFGSMDPAIMRAVVLSMVQQGGGLAVDSSGKLYVDFSTMPDDKFNKLKDSLDMQRTLSGNMSVYVDQDNANASDAYKAADGSIDADRGKETKPFKTLSGAVSYVTKVYAVGSYTVTIYVKARSNSAGANYPYYSESVRLPQYTATSGSITVRAFDYANPPKFRNPSVSSGSLLSCAGGTWNLTRLQFYGEIRDDGDTSYNHFIGGVSASGGGSQLTLRGVKVSMKFIGARGRVGTFSISGLSSRPSSVTIGSAVVFGANGFPGWPANPERPVISDANGTVTFVSATYVAPTGTAVGRLDVKYTFSPADGVTSASYPVTVNGASSGSMSISYASLSSPTYYNMRLLNSWTGATLTIYAMSGYQTELEYDKGNANDVDVIHLEDGGTMKLPSSNTADIAGATDATSIYSIVCSGTSTCFASVMNQSIITMTGGASYYMHYYYKPSDISQTPTGRRFSVSGGSGCIAPHPLSGVEGEGFPGETEGTVQEATYSWYREAAS